MRLFFLSLIFLLVGNYSAAAVKSTPLPADRAFVLSASLNENNQVVFQWSIAKGYYLYRDRVSFTPIKGKKLLKGKVVLPKGIAHKDLVQGVNQIYVDSVEVPLSLNGVPRGVLQLNINYQGCSSAGFCYTPIRKTLYVDFSRVQAPALLDPYMQSAGETRKHAYSSVEKIFMGSRLLLVLIFIGLGLLLSFTPCVLPMVPILSSIIIGQQRQTVNKGKSKSFLLSLSYVFGMALSYAMAGAVIALVGSNVQVVLQQRWVIVLFSAIFVLLAMSLLGFYQLQLPQKLQDKLGMLTGKQKGGTFAGVFFMGALSTLIVSPCVSAPLVGVLAFIANTGDVWLGLLALFSMGIGMGIPLLVIGASAGRFLPKAGVWMTVLERIFGIVMMIMAVWMLARVIPAEDSSKMQSGLQGLFTVVHSPKELDRILYRSHIAGKPVVLDFYADWCASCKEIDREVFSKSLVRNKMQNFTRIRLDLTANKSSDRLVLERFHLVGPPAILFFNCNGQLLSGFTLVGSTNASAVVNHLNKTSSSLSCDVKQS